MKWDLFVSHADKDKKAFVDELVAILEDEGFLVWYDRFTLRPGDSLRESIDIGLAESVAGVVILSHNFFAGRWAQRELDALIGQQTSDGKRVIFVWFGVSAEDVRKKSPLIAGRRAIIADVGVADVAQQIADALKGIDKLSDRALRDVVEQFFSVDPLSRQLLSLRSVTNFRALVGYNNSYESVILRCVDKADADNLDEDELASLADRDVEKWRKEALTILKLPDEVYLEPVREVTDEDALDIEGRLKLWASGRLDPEAAGELLYDLDEWLDLDYLFVFFGIPNFKVTPEQRDELREAVFRIGTRVIGGLADLDWSAVYDQVFNRARRSASD